MKFKSISLKKRGYQKDNTYAQCPVDSEILTAISVPLFLAVPIFTQCRVWWCLSYAEITRIVSL